MTYDEPLAVVDVGSNTVRLLVAFVRGAGVEQILDRSEFVRLGKGVDASGKLAADRMEAACDAITTLVGDARRAGARSVYLVATSAVRDASNGKEFAGDVQRIVGLPLHVINGEQEAAYTYRGATLGLSDQSDVVVCDLGGGSAEVISARHGRVQWSVSLQLGSGRLTERYVHSDPPGSAEIEAVKAAVAGTLHGCPPERADTAVFTGGTATTCAGLLGKDGPLVHLQPSDLRTALALLTAWTWQEVAERRGIRPDRAQVLSAGVAALQAVAEQYHVRDIIITRHGIREGVLLDEAERRDIRKD